MSPQLWCKLFPQTNQVTLAETGLKRDLTLALSYSCICASTKPQEGSTGMGTFWDAPCKNPTCSRAPGQLLSQEAPEIPQPSPCWPFAPAQLFPLPGSGRACVTHDSAGADGAPQTSALHTLHSLTSCRACVTDTSPHTVRPLAQPHSPTTAPSCSHKPQSKCWFSPCGSLGVSQSSGEEAAAGSAEPRHTPPLQHSPKDSHCPPLSPAIPPAARTRHRHS